MRVSGVEAAIDGFAIRDKRFDEFRRKVIRWNQTRIFRGWSITPGFHQLNIDESNAISTDELLRNYEVATAWKCPKGLYHRNGPNYPADLNAMHEAENVLTGEQRRSYSGHLCRIIGPRGYDEWSGLYDFALLSTTAAQRAEAFLRTIGKWEGT